MSSWRAIRAAAGAERGAHRHLALAGERPGEQQVGDVGARDEQHETDRARKSTSVRRDVADDLVEEWHDAERQPAVRRIDVREIAPEARRDPVHLGLGRAAA